jgi:tripartite-type tricarboxylate transporter receptor subunit TctC
VENNTAGAGIAGTLAVARSQPDGHNIVILTGGTPSQQAMRPKQPYDLTKDFALVTTLCAYPMVVAVPPNSPIKDFKDLIARAKANPGKLSYSMNAIGSLHHLLGEWINIEAGIDMQGIPYRGSSQAFMDVTSGRVDLMVDTGTFAFGQIKQGQLRGLAQSAPGRYELAPDVPAVADTLPGVSMMSWLGFAMAKDTPRPIVDKLNSEIRAILAMDDVKAKLAEMGNIPMPSTPEEMHQRISSELAQWKKIIEAKGIKAE